MTIYIRPYTATSRYINSFLPGNLHSPPAKQNSSIQISVLFLFSVSNWNSRYISVHTYYLLQLVYICYCGLFFLQYLYIRQHVFLDWNSISAYTICRYSHSILDEEPRDHKLSISESIFPWYLYLRTVSELMCTRTNTIFIKLYIYIYTYKS